MAGLMSAQLERCNIDSCYADGVCCEPWYILTAWTVRASSLSCREHQAELHRQGVLHAALFGSVARGDARPGSDIDIMIDLDPNARLGVFDYVGLKDYIAGLFDEPVDVVNREGLKPYVKPAALSDAVYAF